MGFWQSIISSIIQGALAGLLNGLLNHPKTTIAASAAIKSVSKQSDLGV